MAVLPGRQARDPHHAHIVRIVPEEVHRQCPCGKGRTGWIRQGRGHGALQGRWNLPSDLRDVRRRERPPGEGWHHPELSDPEDLEGPCHTSRRAVHPSEIQIRPHGLHGGGFHRIVPLIRCRLCQDPRHIGEPRWTVRGGDLQTHRDRQEHEGIRCRR